MSQKTTSLDIQKGKESILDITHFFPMTVARVLDLTRHGEYVDGITIGDHPTYINLCPKSKVSMSRFRTIETLDLAIPEVVDPTRWQQGLLDMVPRPRSINLVPPLYIPYKAIDIRREIPLPKTQTYPDLFARSLPYGLVTRRMKRASQTLYRKHRNKLILAGLGFFVLSIPILSYVAYALTHGYSILEDIVGIRDPQTIRLMVHSARGDFERSNFLLIPFSWIPIDRFDTVRRAAAGGLALTRGIDIILQELPLGSSTGTLTSKNIQDPFSYRAASRDIFPLELLGVTNPTDWITDHQDTLEKAKNELISAGSLYSGVIPTGERTLRMQKIGKTITTIADLLAWSLKNQTNISNMLGHTNPQRYIVFNQNRDEIRANGGFPGSILSFTLYKGNILDYHADDVYYYDWNLYPYKEIPPPGITLLTDTYGLRDVNYYPDFHDTLDKANSFIERSGDATVTTAIAIHQGVVEEILKKTGPVTVSGVTIPFDSHNFSLLMSTLVENKYAREHSPKDILFRFVGVFLSKIQEKNLYLDILEVLEKYRQDGEILYVSRDTDIDAFLSQYRKKLPWELSAPNWIYPVWTSVSGNKSDRYLSRTYQANTKKLDGCKYENTITLATKHNFSKTDTEELKSYFKLFSITDSAEQSKLSFIQGNGKNRAFVRVYTPLGSTIIGSGSDISVTNNTHSTVFSLMMETPVGATTTKTWKYTLDIPNCVSYDNTIEWTRQPGLKEVLVK